MGRRKASDAAIDPRALHLPRLGPDAEVVVYGIAHAGAGAAVWNAVADSVPPLIEIRGIRLPGREKRLRQPKHETVHAAAAEIAAVLAQDAAAHGKPVLVAGSCSGALLARAALARVAATVPVAGLFVARQPPPSWPNDEDARIAALGSAELRVWARRTGLTPATLLDNDKLFGFFEALLRADLALTAGYVHQTPPLSCPIILLQPPGGSKLTSSYVSAWQSETKGPTHVLDVPCDGDGDLLVSHPARFAAAIARAWSLVDCATNGASRRATP